MSVLISWGKGPMTARKLALVSLLLTLLLVGSTFGLAKSVVGLPNTQSTGFTSGSDGSDGALTLTTPGIVRFGPDTPGLDEDGDGVYHFTTIEIGEGVTVVMSGADHNGSIYWLASGDVTIDGTIDLSGEDGYSMDAPPGMRRPSIPGAGGFHGGVSSFDEGRIPATKGIGPGSGNISSNHGSPASYSTVGFNGGSHTPSGKTYGNEFLVPLIGGSGGGGATSDSSTCKISGAGAGGGALLLAADDTITVNGQIIAEGGNTQSSCLISGAGSGGAIHLITNQIVGSGGLSASGGNALWGNPPLSDGGFGGDGRIRLDAFENSFAGETDPVASLGSPVLVLPSEAPEVRITKVDGIDVPANPSGDFELPDVTFEGTDPVTIEIEARSIPPGTTVEVMVFSENGLDQVIESTPLEGTLALSTATAEVVFPFGFTRLLLEANW